MMASDVEMVNHKCGFPLKTPEIHVTISGEEWELCHWLSTRDRFCNEKEPNQYNNGRGNTKADPRRVERVGHASEMAVAKLFGWEIDIGYHENGDRYDFEKHGVTIDVKGALYDAGDVKIRCRNYKRGYYIAPKCDIYIATYRVNDDLRDKSITVAIMGYQTGDFVRSLPEVYSDERAKHLNHELTRYHLRPISELLDVL
jgi:hypothetical protein